MLSERLATTGLDLHVRALRAAGEDARVACGLVLAMMIGGRLAGSCSAARFCRAGAAVTAYSSLLAADVSGVLFRRHDRELAMVYGQRVG